MRAHLIFLVLLMAVAADVWAEVDYGLGRSVVQIQARPPEGGRVFLGSGVVVANGQVATNCHVTLNAGTITVRKGGQRYWVSQQRADVKRDLCLLDVEALPWPAATLGRAGRLRRGDTLYLLGFPRALGLSWSKGSVRSLHRYRGGRIIETSADFVEGASGGGLFNDNNQLVGIATFFSAGTDRHYFAIPSDWVAVVAKSPPHPVGPFRGTPFWQDVGNLPNFLRPPNKPK